MIEDIDGSIAQVLDILRDGRVLARTGERVPLHADTLCLHGDRADAPAFAQALRDVLQREGFVIAAPVRDRMNYWPLLGVAAVVLGFALRWNPVIVVVVAGTDQRDRGGHFAA